jgi:hypothetical protein
VNKKIKKNLKDGPNKKKLKGAPIAKLYVINMKDVTILIGKI